LSTYLRVALFEHVVVFCVLQESQTLPRAGISELHYVIRYSG